MKSFNRAYMTTATTGTGTITLGAAVDGFQTFAAAGVVDADLVSYVIEDGSAWEIGTGTYTAAGTTLARTTVRESSNSDAAINLTGSAKVFLTAIASDLNLLDTAVQPADIASFEDTTALNARDTANRSRANHTGTQAVGTITGLATVATSGAYTDLTGLPTLGTAAATAATDYATAAQGATADTAVQPAAIADMVVSDPTGVTGADAITNVMSLTQAEFDAIVTPDAATLYVVV